MTKHANVSSRWFGSIRAIFRRWYTERVGQAPSKGSRNRRASYRPSIDGLEDRAVPALLTVNSLLDTVAAGNALTSTTVLDDGGANALTGDVPSPNAGARDWFWANLAAGHDTISDKAANELVN